MRYEFISRGGEGREGQGVVGISLRRHAPPDPRGGERGGQGGHTRDETIQRSY